MDESLGVYFMKPFFSNLRQSGIYDTYMHACGIDEPLAKHISYFLLFDGARH
jgi:hypothetical protein